jgi:hypothetical protein
MSKKQNSVFLELHATDPQFTIIKWIEQYLQLYGESY